MKQSVTKYADISKDGFVDKTQCTNMKQDEQVGVDYILG